MKNRILFLFFLLLATLAQAQITFEKGYYIDNLNQRVEGFIKNQDWKNNPTQFEFKPNQTGKAKTVLIDDAQAFGSDSLFHYKRADVKLDRSSNLLKHLSEYSKPDFKEKKNFLKVLVKGSMNLYRFEDQNLIRYFYNAANDTIIPLINKRYREGQKIKENNHYRQQLRNALVCQAVTNKKIKNVKYRERDLVALFDKYNTCKDTNYASIFPVEDLSLIFNLNAKLGLRDAHLNYEKSYRESYEYKDFKNKSILLIGLEAEFIMPFDLNKWAAFLSPTYQNYTAETLVDNIKSSVDYKSIEMPFGIRHYILLNNNSKFFVNIAYVLSLDRNSEIVLKNGAPLQIKSSTNYAFGFGFKYRKVYSIEASYSANRNLLNEHAFQKPFYSGFSLVLGYTLL